MPTPLMRQYLFDHLLLNRVHQIDALELCALLPDQSVDMILADLPYETLEIEWDSQIHLESMWAAFRRIIKPRCVIVLTASQPFTSALVMSNPRWFRYEWIWEKTIATGFLNANVQPLRSHESILVFSDSLAITGTHSNLARYFPQMSEGAPYTHAPKNGKYAGYNTVNRIPIDNKGTRYPRSVIKIPNPNSNSLHPTQKPVALFEYLIKTYTREGDVVLDPVVGSGTTAVAARNCKRRFICGDQSAEYVAIARDRLRMPFERRHVVQNDRVDDLPLFAEIGTFA